MILLVWENNPEGCKFYVDEYRSELHKLADESSGLFINGDPIPDGHSIYELSDLIETLEDIKLPIVFEEISNVYYCGILL